MVDLKKIEQQTDDPAKLKHLIKEQAKTISILEDEIKYWKSKLFGAKSEKYTAEDEYQSNLLNEAETYDDNSLKSRRPTNGQEALNSSLQLSDNTDRRIAVNNNEFVVLDRTSERLYHGHVRTWGQLTNQMKAVLKKAGLVNKKGEINEK